MAMPKVALGSVEGTTLKKGTPSAAHQQRNPVDGDQVHQVHAEHPEEDGQRQRGNHVVLGGERTAHAGVDEFDGPFAEILQSARCAADSAFLATLRNMNMNTAPNSKDMMKVSRFSAQKPIALASSEVCATPQVPSGK